MYAAISSGRSIHLPVSPKPDGQLLRFDGRALGAFLGTTFGIIAAVSAAFAILDIGLDHPAYGALYAIGLVSPFLGALAYSWTLSGSLRPIVALFWPLRFGRGALAILLVPSSVAATYTIAALAGLPLETTHLPSLGALTLAALGWTSVMWAEETGWRGVLLPALQERSGPLVASLLVALAWTVWHVPLLVLLDMPGSAYAWFAMQTLGLSLVMTWAWNRSGNVLVPMMIHGVNNATMMAFVEAVPSWSADELMPVQAMGPVALGLVVFIATRGRLGH
ncbi:CPBP family intramembrane glutamic endopeptidase [Pseudooceanicola sp.]|jgi:membrane protease YdiL (CAAX protease family)|uniref:CPBP family intramembrane glutamic endopeptidase n=1 Tax=Pseudooceanicola sp. TaxID=1914328 RepID=UPI004058EAD1